MINKNKINTMKKNNEFQNYNETNERQKLIKLFFEYEGNWQKIKKDFPNSKIKILKIQFYKTIKKFIYNVIKFVGIKFKDFFYNERKILSKFLFNEKKIFYPISNFKLYKKFQEIYKIDFYKLIKNFSFYDFFKDSNNISSLDLITLKEFFFNLKDFYGNNQIYHFLKQNHFDKNFKNKNIFVTQNFSNLIFNKKILNLEIKSKKIEKFKITRNFCNILQIRKQNIKKFLDNCELKFSINSSIFEDSLDSEFSFLSIE